MELVKYFRAAEEVLRPLDFNALFEGFKRYKFALYTSKEICLEGRIMPYREGFLGNTAIVYEGEHIAIWNMELDPIDDPERLAYSLVHEMFHCHQMNGGERRYPSDLALLNYPDDEDNFLKKHNEKLYLADAYERRDEESFRAFCKIREARLRAYPAIVREELKVETLEGMAEFVGLKALKCINGRKFNEVTQGYLNKLREEGELLFDVRRLSYFVGAIYFLCLEQLGLGVKNSFSSELTAFEQNAVNVEGTRVQVRDFAFVKRIHDELLRARERKLNAFIDGAKFVAAQASICGYDPMNMYRVGNIILCSHFICLREEDKTELINRPVALKLKENSDNEIVGYYIK